MSGFPNRPARSAFGPVMENARPVTNPAKELSADQMNLTFWQVAGAGRVMPQAFFVYDGVTPALVSQALAFDPRGILSNVSVTKLGTGSYRFTFASTYNDETGNPVAFSPKAAVAIPQGAAAQVQANPTINGQQVTVAVRDGANVATDATVLVLVW